MSLFIPSLQRALDANGVTVSGAEWHFFVTGTVTPADTYTTNVLNVEHSNPVVADSGGLFASIYLDPEITYRAILKTPGGATLQDIDPYDSVDEDEVFSIGLFVDADGAPIGDPIDLLRTTGYSAAGSGPATYVYDADVDQNYVDDNPRTSFLAESGRGFKLSEKILTPYMFGAVGNGADDDTVPLQALLDHAYHAENRRVCRYDWSGKWAVSETMYMAYPYYGDEQPVVMECGTLLVLPVADQPGAVPMDVVLIISGTRNMFSGYLYINGFNAGYTLPLYPVNERRFIDGIWCCQTNGSVIPDIKVDGSIRHMVVLKTELFTFREGTPYEVFIPANNQISTKFKTIYTRYSGSCIQGGYSHAEKLTFTSNTPGAVIRDNVDIDLCTWSTDYATYADSVFQASRLAIADHGYLQNGDFIQLRHSILVGTFGTIALDTSDSTMTWSAGDPVAAGLVVGDRIAIRHDIGGEIPSTDNYVSHEIIGFSGTSNRVIKIDPAPDVDMAAFAVQKLWIYQSLHWVVRVGSGFVDVFPWVPTRSSTQDVYSIYGAALQAPGADASGVTVDMITTFGVGIALNAAGLYGPHISTIVADHADISIVQGLEIGAAASGGRVDYLHSEATSFDFVQLQPSSTYSNFYVGSPASLVRAGCISLVPKNDPADVFSPIGADTLVNATISFGDGIVMPRVGVSNPANIYTSAGLEISNLPAHRKRDFWANSGTFYVGYDPDFGRMSGEYSWAEVTFLGATGGTPSGTITLEMNYYLQLRGWQFVGVGTKSAGLIADQITAISGLTAACVIRLFYNRGTKKISVQRVYFA